MSESPETNWHLRKELSIGTVVSLILLGVGSIAAFATVQNELSHKASKAQVDVVVTKQREFDRDIQEMKGDLKEILRELREDR